ncbi:MAG: glycoside hydrolase family 3 C-terminal domain-containing protein, partial [Deltaproteobacteria bacterium]|nr:glycoside hydrolase family 3 C-terminal domain-containing protein [Deltaproteobacteria bacterium]
SSAGRSRLSIDGREVVDNWTQQEKGESFYGAGSTEKRGTVYLNGPCEVEILYSKEGAPILGGLQVGALEPIGEDAMARAEAAAAAADVALVVVGLNGDWETEGKDRESLELPGEQSELIERVIAANPRTVVALNAGSPITGAWMDRAPALLTLWYGGQEAGNALADVLFGDACPSGRLPQTWPVRLEDNPTQETYPGEDGRVVYGEGVFMGYRWYDSKEIAPRFAFGHGLSYTRFEYGAVEVQATGADVEVRVPVTNTGQRAGQEVIQLYVSDPEARVVRPEKELRAFRKLTLEPGELRVVRFSLGSRAFAFWDSETHDWCVEPGAFEILVGGASDAIRSRATFPIQV